MNTRISVNFERRRIRCQGEGGELYFLHK